MTHRVFTKAEKVARVRAIVGELRADDGNTTHLDRLDRINDKGRDRAIREYATWQTEHEEALYLLAAARTAVRTASRAERAQAKQDLKDAEKRVKRVERAEPKR